MKNKIILSLTMLLICQVVHAQRGRNAMEASQNQKAIATNEAQLERDLKELNAYKAKMAEFETAFAGKNGPKVMTIKAELTAMMKREIEQSEKKIVQDQQEMAQSKSELAASSRESRRSRYNAAPHGVRDDRRDRRDDQRDAMDDKADLEQQIARTKRQKQIHATLQAFTFSFEPSLQEKAVANKALLHEFVDTMEKDIAATKAEIIEDKREAAEDRRERREDRRQRQNRNW